MHRSPPPCRRRPAAFPTARPSLAYVTQDSTDEGQFRTDIELQHECACANASVEDCRNGYTERQDREDISEECNNLAESGRNILKWMALGVTIFIWGLEWRVTGRSWECETLTKHPTYIYKDCRTRRVRRPGPK